MQEKVVRRNVTVDTERRQFTKRFCAEDLEFQVAKENRLAEIFSDCEKIKVPELIHSNRDNFDLTYEYIEDLVSFRSLLGNKSLASDLAKRVGAGIARAHQQLDLPDEFKIRLPEPYGRFEADNAFLHLDLSTVNVQYSKSRDCVYLIDWQLSPMLKSNGNFGSIYFDLSFFCSNLFMVEPYVLTNARYKTDLLRSLIHEYQLVYGKLDLEEFEKVGMVHFNSWRKLETRMLKKAACWINHANYKTFISRLQMILS